MYLPSKTSRTRQRGHKSDGQVLLRQHVIRRVTNLTRSLSLRYLATPVLPDKGSSSVNKRGKNLEYRSQKEVSKTCDPWFFGSPCDDSFLTASLLVAHSGRTDEWTRHWFPWIHPSGTKHNCTFPLSPCTHYPSLHKLKFSRFHTPYIAK